MLYGEHLHADEQPPHCLTCPRRAAVEVFGDDGASHGCFCLRCGRRKLEAVQRVERMTASRGSR